jgi:hypothetical protein
MDQIAFPGDVNIKNLALVSPNTGNFLPLQDYLIELNLMENIFSPVLTGTLLLSDSRNLIQEFQIDGSEYLILTFVTPGLELDNAISKAFRIYGLENKNYVNDGSTLVYQLNFSSVEQFNDILNAGIFKEFKGKPEEVIQELFFRYMQDERNVRLAGEPDTGGKSSLTILGESDNTIKFTSPGWSPIECINWVASKTLPKNSTAANYLFWETTKGFYFGSMDEIFNAADTLSIGEYVYSQAFISSLGSEERNKAMYAIKSLRINKSFDQVSNNLSGYFASRIVDVDLYNKQYETVNYNHIEKFSNYKHSEGNPEPMFNKASFVNPSNHIEVNYSHSKLYDNQDNNFDTKVKYIYGNRRSNLLELQNFNMEIVISGRTDIEVGNFIKIKIPKKDPGAIGNESKNTNKNDHLYSGNYLITGLTHKINFKTHTIAMTCVKDSFSSKETI